MWQMELALENTNVSDLPKIETKFADPKEELIVYKRDPETLARTQAIPGQAGLEHRIGGLEKSEDGGVSYDPENHEKMTQLRADKVNGIASSYDPIEVQGKKKENYWLLDRRHLWCYLFCHEGSTRRRFFCQ